MKIALVVAAGLQNEIGAQGKLLWHLPRDMQFFKSKTMGHCVLMGRKTFESIPEKFRPLVGRTNIILSRSEQNYAGCICTADLQEALLTAQLKNEMELMVIGGGELYRALFSLADVIYLTRVQASFPQADTFFPQVHENEWLQVTVEKYEADERNKYAMEFCTLVRRR